MVVPGPDLEVWRPSNLKDFFFEVYCGGPNAVAPEPSPISTAVLYTKLEKQDASVGLSLQLTVLAVEEGGEHDEQAGERGLVDEAAVGVQRAQRDRALARVAQALRQPHHEQVHRRLAVVQRQRAQHRRQSVGTTLTISLPISLLLYTSME